MPKRFCQCSGCPACGTTSGLHGALYDRSAAPGYRCPACQVIATKRRNADPPGRPSASQRGYGADWRRISDKLIAAATQCAICGGEFTRADPATVDHIVAKARGGTNDEQNLRVVHRSCNSRRVGQMLRGKRTGRSLALLIKSLALLIRSLARVTKTVSKGNYPMRDIDICRIRH